MADNMHEIIQSKDNQKIKEIRKLKQKKYRTQTGYFLIEGQHLIDEALSAHQNIKVVIVSEKYDISIDDYQNVYIVPDAVMATLSSLDTPPGIMAVVQYVPPTETGNRVLMLEDIQDPGNMGTLIRSASAFNFDKIYLSKNCVDVFSGKVLRSTQGMLFTVNIEVVDLVETIQSFDGDVYMTSTANATPLEGIMHQENKIAIVLGNEGSGISQALKDVVDGSIMIEMSTHTESLNVAVAGSIIMHHFKKNNRGI